MDIFALFHIIFLLVTQNEFYHRVPFYAGTHYYVPRMFILDHANCTLFGPLCESQSNMAETFALTQVIIYL